MKNFVLNLVTLGAYGDQSRLLNGAIKALESHSNGRRRNHDKYIEYLRLYLNAEREMEAAYKVAAERTRQNQTLDRQVWYLNGELADVTAQRDALAEKLADVVKERDKLTKKLKRAA